MDRVSVSTPKNSTSQVREARWQRNKYEKSIVKVRRVKKPKCKKTRQHKRDRREGNQKRIQCYLCCCPSSWWSCLSIRVSAYRGALPGAAWAAIPPTTPTSSFAIERFGWQPLCPFFYCILLFLAFGCSCCWLVLFILSTYHNMPSSVHSACSCSTSGTKTTKTVPLEPKNEKQSPCAPKRNGCWETTFVNCIP